MLAKSKFRRRRAVLALLPMLMPPAAFADGWGGSLVGTSDYVYRGLTQSDNKPSVQGDVHYDWSTGWFAGLWAASVKRGTEPSNGAELNGYLGHAWALGESWSTKLAYVHYAYPGIAPRRRYDYDELTGTLAWRDQAFLSVAASPDSSVETTRGAVSSRKAYTYELALHQPLRQSPPWGLAANAGIGYYDLRRLVGTGYAYWNAGVACDFGVLQLDLSYIGTSAGAKSLFYDSVAVNRVVATLLWHF